MTAQPAPNASVRPIAADAGHSTRGLALRCLASFGRRHPLRSRRLTLDHYRRVCTVSVLATLADRPSPNTNQKALVKNHATSA